MNKIQIFANTFKKSVTSPAYYLEFIKAKTSFGFKYLAFLVFLQVLVITILSTIFLFNLNKNTPKLTEGFYTIAKQLYPTDLIVTVDKGEVSTNSLNPTVIKIPTEVVSLLSFDMNEKEIQEFETEINKYSLLVIDTKGQVGDFNKYNTLALVTKNNISYVKKANEGGVSSYETVDIPKDSEKMVITNAIYQMFVDQVNSEFLVKIPELIKGLIISIALVLPLLGTLIIVSNYWILLFIHALFLKISNSLLHKGYSYKELYKIGTLSLTIPITLDIVFFVLWFLGVFSNNNIFLLPLVHFVFSTFILYKLPQKEVTQPVITPVIVNG